MNPYRLIPLLVSSVVIVALFAVICWLAIMGDHDMRVAVISLATGGTLGASAGAVGTAALLKPTAPAQTGDQGL